MQEKKTALLSACNPNYGSMLQSYAFQCYLTSKGIETEIITYTERPLLRQITRVFNFPLLKMKIKAMYRDWSCRLFRPQLWKKLECRNQKFMEFRNARLQMAVPYTSRAELVANTNHYKAFIVGSDQLWNPVNLGTDFYTLSFVPDRTPKLTYATSFGVSRIPRSQVARTRKYLQRIDSISTREKSGQQIIREIAGRDVPVVCDPTMLVGRPFWDKVKGITPIVDGAYILCYFIGSRTDIRTYATWIGQQMNMPIIVLPHIDQFVKADCTFGDQQLFEVGPSEFVNLVSNATLVLTDSFHGTVFSILYECPFLSFDRFLQSQTGSMNSRIDSLLGILELSERKINSAGDIERILKAKLDWQKPQKRLADFQLSSQTYGEKLKTLIDQL